MATGAGKAGLANSSMLGGVAVEVGVGKSQIYVAGASPQVSSCPKCSSSKVWKDGQRQALFGAPIQRWLCRDCGLRFSDPAGLAQAKAAFEASEPTKTKALKSNLGIVSSCQICVSETKNLGAEQQLEVLQSGKNGEFIQKIFDFENWLRTNGKAEETIRTRRKLLRRLVKRGAHLYDPQSIKDTIAKQAWGNGQKNNAVDAYSSFLAMVGGKWDPPTYIVVRKIPFIPKEAEIDQLIAGCSSRVSTFIQCLKETGARCGEIWQLNWNDIDFESKVINITPEKNSNPRVAHLSNNLLEMLQNLPRNYENRVFSRPSMRLENFRVNFNEQRRRIAKDLANSRILRIHFHTLRYWKGTMLYHQTKDLYYVMQRLGHKNIKNTMLYVQLEEALFQGENEYISKVAKNELEICALVEAGFEYVTDFQGAKIFRKRK